MREQTGEFQTNLLSQLQVRDDAFQTGILLIFTSNNLYLN